MDRATTALIDSALEDYQRDLVGILRREGLRAYIVGDLRVQLKIRRAMRAKFGLMNAPRKKSSQYGYTPKTDVGGTRISFDHVAQEALDYVVGYVDNLITRGGCTIQGEFVPWLAGRSERLRENIAGAIEEALREGSSNETLASALQDIFDVDRRHALTIARTEMARIEVAGAMNRYQSCGIEQVLWNNGPDPCPICEAVGGQVYALDDIPWEIPVHPNCCCDLVPIVTVPPPEETLFEEDEIAALLGGAGADLSALGEMT